MKQSSNFDLKRVTQKLSSRVDPELLTRRNVVVVGAGLLALAVVSAWYLRSSGEAPTATKRRARPTEVSVEELMKPGQLPDMQLGSKDAPITVVEYASMTCGHCANFHNQVFPKLKEKYIDSGKARLILREFPLDDRATGAAMLARCVGDDKTFPLVSALFARQDQWAFVPKESFVPELSKVARQAGFTEESMRQCLTDQALMDKILADRKRAVDEFGVDSTPTFFINGKRLTSGNGIEDFDKAFAPLLKS